MRRIRFTWLGWMVPTLLVLTLTVVSAADATLSSVLSGSINGNPNEANPLQVKQLSISYDTAGTINAAIALFNPLPVDSPSSEGEIDVILSEPELTLNTNLDGSTYECSDAGRVSISIGGPGNSTWTTAEVRIGHQNSTSTVPVSISQSGLELNISIAGKELFRANLQCYFANSSWEPPVLAPQYQHLPVTFFPGYPTSIPIGTYLDSAEDAAEAPARAAAREALAARERAEQEAREAIPRLAVEAEERNQREAIEQRQKEATNEREASERREAESRCVVPSLRGESLSTARRKLATAHCKLGKVVEPRRHPNGRLVITKQTPGRGKRLHHGAAVTVTLESPRSS